MQRYWSQMPFLSPTSPTDMHWNSSFLQSPADSSVKECRCILRKQQQPIQYNVNCVQNNLKWCLNRLHIYNCVHRRLWRDLVCGAKVPCSVRLTRFLTLYRRKVSVSSRSPDITVDLSLTFNQGFHRSWNLSFDFSGPGYRSRCWKGPEKSWFCLVCSWNTWRPRKHSRSPLILHQLKPTVMIII